MKVAAGISLCLNYDPAARVPRRRAHQERDLSKSRIAHVEAEAVIHSPHAGADVRAS